MTSFYGGACFECCAMGIGLHVWKRGFLQGLDPPLELSCMGVTFAQTRMSLMLFGRLNATIGFSWNTVELRVCVNVLPVFANDVLYF